MRNIRFLLIVMSLLLCSVTTSTAGVSIGIGLPNVSIGINLPVYPELVPVPGYPVYYAPGMNANYFFYDGMYWVYSDDNWYASSWYNGPWGYVEPVVVPLFILRVPVSYYRQPPLYFRGWVSNAPPRWGQHWGHSWEQRRGGWDRWERRSAPAPAPLPVYQRQYSGDRYPRVEQQHAIRSQSYHYQPRNQVVRQHFKQEAVQKAPAPAQRGKQEKLPATSPRQQETQRPAPLKQGAPTGTVSQPQHPGGENIHRSAPAQTTPQQRGSAVREQKQQPNLAPQDQRQQSNPVSRDQRQQRDQAVHDQKQQPGASQREQQAPKSQGHEQRQQQDRGQSQEPRQNHGQGQNRDEERGR